MGGLLHESMRGPMNDVVGYGFSLGVGALCTMLVSNSLWKGLGWAGSGHSLRLYAHHPAMLGCVERGLYTASWQLGRPEFIAVWLALKVAGQWSRWGTVETVDGVEVVGRAVFNVFLIGNALSIAFGIVGGLLIDWLQAEEAISALASVVALVLGTLALYLWSEHRRRDANRHSAPKDGR